jgi:hypothetical protein
MEENMIELIGGLASGVGLPLVDRTPCVYQNGTSGFQQ